MVGSRPANWDYASKYLIFRGPDQPATTRSTNVQAGGPYAAGRDRHGPVRMGLWRLRRADDRANSHAAARMERVSRRLSRRGDIRSSFGSSGSRHRPPRRQGRENRILFARPVRMRLRRAMDRPTGDRGAAFLAWPSVCQYPRLQSGEPRNSGYRAIERHALVAVRGGVWVRVRASVMRAPAAVKGPMDGNG